MKRKFSPEHPTNKINWTENWDQGYSLVSNFKKEDQSLFTQAT